jgi:hypothetical protein
MSLSQAWPTISEYYFWCVLSVNLRNLANFLLLLLVYVALGDNCFRALSLQSLARFTELLRNQLMQIFLRI